MGILVPLAPFLMVVAIVGFAMWSRVRRNAAINQTLQNAIQKGVELSPETIKALSCSRRNNLRSGMILIAVALGMIALGFGINVAEPDEQIIPILAGAAAIPGFIGIALLFIHFFMKSDESA